MRKHKTNDWKTISIFLLIVALVLMANLLVPQKVYTLNKDFKIEKNNFDSIIKGLNENPILQEATTFQLCSIKEDKCIQLNRKIG